MLRHRDRHNRRPTQPLRLDWPELIAQANNAILRSVIKRAPELENQIRSIRYELFDLPNLAQVTAGQQSLATASLVNGQIHLAIFRRPIEVRANKNKSRVLLIRYAIAEALAELLNIDVDLLTGD